MSDAPAPTRAEEGREIIAELERELGVTGTANVFRKALAIAKEASRTGECSGFSGAGVRTVIGCPADIDLVKRWCEEASTIPYLKDRIKVAESRTASAKAEADRLRERVATLKAALQPFASITPSSFYSADGSEAEGYRAFLHEGRPRPEFTGADLARARTALEAPHADGPGGADAP